MAGDLEPQVLMRENTRLPIPNSQKPAVVFGGWELEVGG